MHTFTDRQVKPSENTKIKSRRKSFIFNEKLLNSFPLNPLASPLRRFSVGSAGSSSTVLDKIKSQQPSPNAIRAPSRSILERYPIPQKEILRIRQSIELEKLAGNLKREAKTFSLSKYMMIENVNFKKIKNKLKNKKKRQCASENVNFVLSSNCSSSQI